MSSTSFYISTFARDETARSTLPKGGAGLPLQRFERVQLAFLTKDEPGTALSRMSAIMGMAPS